MNKNNIKSVGDIHLEAGDYGDISCAGDLRFSGSVSAENVKAAGDLVAEKDVRAVKISVYGDGKFKGNLEADEISVYGDGNFLQRVKGREIKIYGSMKGTVVEGEKITINGELEKVDEISAEELTLNGEFHVTSSMNLGYGKFNLGGKSEAKEIFCEELEVRNSMESFHGILSGLISKGKGGTLKVGVIEGDEIYLENTAADVVRGKIVKIGKGSKIGKVEYSDTLEIFDDGVVDLKEEF
ncbi:MAG: hypothetical protein EOM07_09175 [Clostridia bacterium]|jgi:cytoskeletal protein CcmA (bactofilin family)|nr:hypothetical protein [Clostridia bacterium]